MANVNNLSPFALSVSANVMSSSAWAALATRLSGWQSGIAPSIQVNTAVRQAMFVAIMIAQFTADWGNANVVDDGNIPNFEANFEAALTKFVNSLFAGQWWTGNDTGTASHLVLTPTQTFTAYASLQGFIVKLANNIAAGADINVNGLGAKAIIYPDGTAVRANDYLAGATLILVYDGTKMQIDQTPLSSQGVPTNSQIFSTTTRVVMVGNSGNSYSVTAWSPGNYVKKSATSKLYVWCMLPTFTPVSPGQGAPQMLLTIGGVTQPAISGNNQSVQVTGMNPSVFEFDSVGVGSQAVSVVFKRNDTTAWQMSFCPSTTDLGSLASSSQATIMIMEVGA